MVSFYEREGRYKIRKPFDKVKGQQFGLVIKPVAPDTFVYIIKDSFKNKSEYTGGFKMEILGGAVLIIAVIGTWARLEYELYEIKRKK